MSELIKQMSTFELGLNVTITGIVLVFSMLLLLVLILILFGKISVALQNLGEKKREKQRAAMLKAMADEPSDEETITSAIVENDEGLTEEIVAVISAAVSTLYAGSGRKPVIKTVKRTGSRRSAWANAGVADNTRAFLRKVGILSNGCFF